MNIPKISRKTGGIKEEGSEFFFSEFNRIIF
jgi:hypothetical protein